MIPGAFEVRVGRPTTQPASAIAAPLAPSGPAAPVYDRERLEREREGGGAPSERTDTQHRTLFARLYDRLVGRKG
jgi:hypothetical protein